MPGIEHEPADARKLLGALPPAVARAILDNGIPFAFRTTLADVARAILEHDSRDGIVAELPGAVLAIGGGTFHAFTQWKQAIYDLAARTARIEPKPWPTSATADTSATASPELSEDTRLMLRTTETYVLALGLFAPEIVTAGAAEMSASVARGASPTNPVNYLISICRRLSKQAPPPLPERSDALGRDA